MPGMCGRIIQASPPDQLALKIVSGLEDRDNRVPTGTNSPPRYNGAPSQQHWVIRSNRQTGECSLDLLQWGLLPNWCKDPKALRPINAMAETVAAKPYFRALARRRLRPIQAKKRSTTQRRGWTAKPIWSGFLRTISTAMAVAPATRFPA